MSEQHLFLLLDAVERLGGRGTRRDVLVGVSLSSAQADSAWHRAERRRLVLRQGELHVLSERGRAELAVWRAREVSPRRAARARARRRR